MRKIQSIKTDKKAAEVIQRMLNLKKSHYVQEYLMLQEALSELEKRKEAEKPAPPIKERDFFTKIISKRMTSVNEMLIIKGAEYVRGSDRAHNFRRGAEMDRINMPRTLHGYLKKHLVSYLDMLDDIDKGKYISSALIDQKIGDIIVYFFLQEAIINLHQEETFMPPIA